MKSELDALIGDLTTVSTNAPGIASRTDQKAEMAAQMGLHDLDTGAGLQQALGTSEAQLSTLSDSTDQDDLVYALSQKAADSAVDSMIRPMRGGS